MSEPYSEYTFMCAICAIRWKGVYSCSDTKPEQSICPECEKKITKLELSWESSKE